MVISIASMVKKRAIATYFTQSGIISSGDGEDEEDSADEGGVSSGDGSVMKALTSLQAL